MINLPFDISQNDINDNGNEAYNYYYIDEPFYRQLINQNFLNIASWVYQKNPTALFIMSDFYWPEFDLLCYGHEGNGNTVKTYWFPNPNVRIMCDQYDGNGCGDVHSFWDEYKAFYGIPNRNLTNWITLEPGHSPDWGDLLNVAMAWSQWGAMNPIWIYAGDNNVTESTLEYFCETAWETHWLYRYRKHVIVTYQCSGPNCVWGLGGEWSIYRMRYDGQEGYVGY